MKPQWYVLEETGEPAPTHELMRSMYESIASCVPSARADEAIRFAKAGADRIADDDYTIRTLIDWLGGIDKVAEIARDKRNWVMRDVATAMGSKLSWSSLDSEVK